ncbi:MAG: hypothetical protein JWR18_1890 [Segetibacter sp.]|jgi:hypothetical protein|nr:hypothetical protein [Segetibacter sp.]
MKALKTILLLFLCNFLSQNLCSQYYYYSDKYFNTPLLFEFGVGVGSMNCITDVGGANTDNPNYFNEIRLNNSHFSKSIYGSITYQSIIAARLEATLGMVESADSTITGKTNNLVSKNVRNLSFRSNISEVTFTTEFHPFQLLGYELLPFVSPYVIAGVGWFRFNPQAYLKGKWIDLQPLHTEGQGFSEYPDRKPYSLSQFNIPLGLGIRYEMNGMFNIRAEFVHRRLFTDYLDDASTKELIDESLFAKYLPPADAVNARALYNRSTDGSKPIFRGHSQNNDAYMSVSLKLGVVLGRESTGSRAGTRQLRCAF